MSDSDITSPLRPQSTGHRSMQHELFPFEAWKFDLKTETNPRLMLQSPWQLVTPSVRFTPDGGIAVKMIAGEALVQGNVVQVDTNAYKEVEKIATSQDDPLGVVFAAAASGADVWIIIGGIGYVLFDSATTPAINFHVYVSTADAGTAAGQLGINTARHWGEIGHCLETPGGGAGALARCLIHFN